MENGRKRLLTALMALVLAMGMCPTPALANTALSAGEVAETENAPSNDDEAGKEQDADGDKGQDAGVDDPQTPTPSVSVTYAPVAFGETCTLEAKPDNVGEDAVLAYSWELQTHEDAEWTVVDAAEDAALEVPMDERAVGARYRVQMTVSQQDSENGSEAPADNLQVYSEPITLEAAEKEEGAEYAGPTIEIRRLANPYSCRHLYTPSPEEAQATENAGWISQGVAWLAPETSEKPVYRVYNPYGGEHFYTADSSEHDSLVSAGWEDEGVGFYSVAQWGIPIYRLYNPYNGDHHFTASERECEDLEAVGWTDEGIKLRGVQAGEPYDGTPDWAEAVVKDQETGVTAEGMVFAQQTLQNNTVEFQVENIAGTDLARYNLLRKTFALAKTNAFAAYDAKLVLHKADGTTVDLRSGFGDFKLSLPIGKQYDGANAQVVHLGTRANGRAFIINRTRAIVEEGVAKLSINYFSESGSSEFIVAVGDGEMSNASILESLGEPVFGQSPLDEDDLAVQEMHRLYNPYSGEHFYTADVDERDAVANDGWVYEGVGWIAPKESATPVYRLYSGTDHHYTTSIEERDAIVGAGWTDEGIGWYSDDNEGVPLYRQYNPNVKPDAPSNNAGAHNYTTSIEENDSLVAIGWIAEGVGWYGVSQE